MPSAEKKCEWSCHAARFDLQQNNTFLTTQHRHDPRCMFLVFFYLYFDTACNCDYTHARHA